MSVLAVGLDLGSTAIKAAILDGDERLAGIESAAAPPLHGEGEIREGDAAAYLEATLGVLRKVAQSVPAGTPLGLATQRSTFTVWGRDDGRPQLPMISWQDRRAAGWCDRHRQYEPEISARTGLPLSTHYIGPKLAAMQEADPAFRDLLRRDDRVFGTLETFFQWRCGADRRHESNLTVAARSLLLDLDCGDWSPELQELFDVPPGLLPRVVQSSGRNVKLDNGLRLAATLSDQAAAALAVFDEIHGSVLVNLGTGAFVLRPVGATDGRVPGYLYAPILAASGAETRYALEGTINGAGPAVAGFGRPPTQMPATDPCPDGFAVPDQSGLGAPHWRPDIGLTFSAAARDLPETERRRIVVEGLLFRIREILEELHPTGLPERIILAGGLVADPGVGAGLATLLGRPIEQLLERESGLLGVSRLAAGLQPYARSPTGTIEPGPSGNYLPDKFERWKAWFATILVG